jgi:hypothetical protein
VGYTLLIVVGLVRVRIQGVGVAAGGKHRFVREGEAPPEGSMGGGVSRRCHNSIGGAADSGWGVRLLLEGTRNGSVLGQLDDTVEEFTERRDRRLVVDLVGEVEHPDGVVLV